MCKLSIIVPIYNAEETLDRCLYSVQTQTFGDFEVLLINDGSTDTSLEKCVSYSKKDNRFKVYSQQNKGVSSARNKGIDNASGKYVYFIDSDDYIAKNAIEKLYEAALSTGADVTVCGYNYVQKDGRIIPESEKMLKPGVYKDKACKEIAVGILSNTSRKIYIEPYSGLRLIKRDSLEKPRLRFMEDLTRSEDLLFSTELHFRINTLTSINDQKLYYYVDTEGSITNNYVDNYWLSIKNIVKIITHKLSSSKEIDKGLNIMLIYRSIIALNNATRAEDVDVFNSSVSEILNDIDLFRAINSLKLTEGYQLFGPYYLLMRFRLKKIVRSRYYNKFRK